MTAQHSIAADLEVLPAQTRQGVADFLHQLRHRHAAAARRPTHPDLSTVAILSENRSDFYHGDPHRYQCASAYPQRRTLSLILFYGTFCFLTHDLDSAAA